MSALEQELARAEAQLAEERARHTSQLETSGAELARLEQEHKSAQLALVAAAEERHERDGEQLARCEEALCAASQQNTALALQVATLTDNLKVFFFKLLSVLVVAVGSAGFRFLFWCFFPPGLFSCQPSLM